MENKLELRMYGFVNYQLTGIQKGIQFAHAIVEYGLYNNNSQYLDWAKNHKTVIVLNGGTTNNNPDRPGTINQIIDKLQDINIDFSKFSEPDLGDQITAVAFILDERVFNRKKYPEFHDFLKINYMSYIGDDLTIEEVAYKISQSKFQQDIKIYKQWVDLIGGQKNVQLREFIKDFSLA
jgi:hypothetical protein